MNKRGQGLPLNTLIIVILVVIVLIVVAVFFLGGTSSLSRSIRSIFYGTTTGTDLVLAVEQCNNHCSSVEGLPIAARVLSGYCRTTFDIDRDGDGQLIDTGPGGDYIGIKCWDPPISNGCTITDTNADGTPNNKIGEIICRPV